MQEVTPESEETPIDDKATVEETTATAPHEAEVVPQDEAHDVDEDDDEFDEEDEDEDEDDELAEAQAHVGRLQEELRNMQARVLRTQADLENYKKRAEREKQESIKYASKRLFGQILEVMDNFDRALMAITDPKDNLAIGVSMIHKQLQDVLAQNGVEEIVAIGRPFDPYLDEALAQEPRADVEEHTVIEVFQKGYRFQGNLLRATKVKVATAMPAAAEETSSESEEASSEG